MRWSVAPLTTFHMKESQRMFEEPLMRCIGSPAQRVQTQRNTKCFFGGKAERIAT